MPAMNIEIHNDPLQLEVYGFGDNAIDRDYTGTAFKLSGRMWQLVKSKGIKNKGKNIWVYAIDPKVFAGVELEEQEGREGFGLERLEINLKKYAIFKHIGAYQLIARAGQAMRDQLTTQGYKILPPYIEIYGHWAADESKLETELIVNLQ